ncbi:MAG: amidohydrolase family protein [Candidatus Asgardarchaeia archaeon]
MGIIIDGGIIVTSNKENQIIENGAVVIEGNTIIDVGKHSRIANKYNYSDYEIIDAHGKVVIPGFVNTHCHTYQNFMKGWHDDLSLEEWCNLVLFPIVRLSDKYNSNGFNEFYYYGALLASIEAIKTGTTTLLDFSANYKMTLKAFDDIGIRGIAGVTLANKWIPEDLVRPPEKVLKDVRDAISEWHNSRNGRLKMIYAPSTPYICTEDFLKMIKEESLKTGVPITTHVSEQKYEVELVKKETGLTPIRYLNKIGLLDENLLAVHCVWVDDEEINLIAKSGAKVSHNPKSNTRLASGIAPITKMYKEKNITVSLATDGAASNDNLDMIEVMRTAAFLAKVSTLRADSLTGLDVFRMATIDGARAINMEHEIGSIEVGKKADIAIINLQASHLQPVFDVINTIVYVANGHDVDTVIIDGKVIMKNRTIQTIDEEKILETIQEKFADELKQVFNETMEEKLRMKKEGN